MTSENFRELNVDLPRQPITDQRPWFVAGLVFVLVLALIAIGAYLHHTTKAGTEEQVQVNSSSAN